MKRFFTLSAIFILALSGTAYILFSIRNSSQTQNFKSHSGTPVYSYRILKTYPHDKRAFTQGLVFDNGYLYEGTGLYGFSSLRKVDLRTGEILKIQILHPKFFGEGITILHNKIFQLTYQSHIGFVYDKNTFKRIKEFHYPTEGWGITSDGQYLIMSDGTSSLYFFDPETFKTVKTIIAHDHRGNITRLNELEFVQGKILANIWQEDRLAEINPATGEVEGWIELAGLLSPEDMHDDIDVLNGIAYDTRTGHLFVTGKLWPKIFEIERIEQK